MRLQLPRLARPLVPMLLTLVAVPALSAPPAPAVSKPTASASKARQEDVSSPEAVVAALYDVISGPKGQVRDWNRFRSLFAPGARMVPSGKRADGVVGHRVLTPEEYIAQSQQTMVDQGFREREVSRVVERFGPLAHVFSTYEAFREGETKPFMRGINSIQLLHDGQRWWLLTVAWTPETLEQPLPAKYLVRSKG